MPSLCSWKAFSCYLHLATAVATVNMCWLLCLTRDGNKYRIASPNKGKCCTTLSATTQVGAEKEANKKIGANSFTDSFSFFFCYAKAFLKSNSRPNQSLVWRQPWNQNDASPNFWSQWRRSQCIFLLFKLEQRGSQENETKLASLKSTQRRS